MALRKVLYSKIHRATVTQADLEYEGSVTLPPDLLEASGIAEFEAVNIWNVTAGTRLETYALRGLEGSRDICVNGAAAHLVSPGDMVIIASFQHIEEERLPGYEPKVVFVDEQNRIKELRKEVPGPQTVQQAMLN
jgi:aspartate 1-decarboxylase